MPACSKQEVPSSCGIQISTLDDVRDIYEITVRKASSKACFLIQAFAIQDEGEQKE
jgi:hypothetical protein